MMKTVFDHIKRLAILAPLTLAIACGGKKHVAQPKPGMPPLPPAIQPTIKSAKIKRPKSTVQQIVTAMSVHSHLHKCVIKAYTCADKKKELRPYFGYGDLWERLAYCRDYVTGCSGDDK